MRKKIKGLTNLEIILFCNKRPPVSNEPGDNANVLFVSLQFLTNLEGFEPSTYCLGGNRAIQATLQVQSIKKKGFFRGF